MAAENPTRKTIFSARAGLYSTEADNSCDLRKQSKAKPT